MRRMRGLILVVALVFAACGGDDPTEPIHGNDTIDHGDQITPDGDDAKDDAEDVSGRTDNVTPGDDTSGPGDTGDDNGGGPSSDDSNGDSSNRRIRSSNQCKKEETLVRMAIPVPLVNVVMPRPDVRWWGSLHL